MSLLEVIKKHEKEFESWWFDGADFSAELEESLVEIYKDVIPYAIQKGIDGDTSEWLNEFLPQDILDIRFEIDKDLKNLNFLKRLSEDLDLEEDDE